MTNKYKDARRFSNDDLSLNIYFFKIKNTSVKIYVPGKVALLVAAFFTTCSIFAQPATHNQSVLTIGQIMQGEKFIGYLPDDIRWSDDSRAVYFSWNPANDTLRTTYKVTLLEGGIVSEPEPVGIEEQKAMPASGNYNKDRTKKVFAKNGDLFLLDLPSQSVLQITNTLSIEHNPVFSADGSKVFFEKSKNLYAWDCATGSLRQLTDFKKGFEEKEEPKSEQEQWLENDQLSLFETLLERKLKEQVRKRRYELLRPRRPKTYYYGDKHLDNLRISPDGRFVTFRLTERTNPERTKVPNYVTRSGKTGEITARPKVGSPVASTEIGIYDRQVDSVYFVDPSGIEGIFDKPAYLRLYQPDSLPWESQYKYPRPLVFHGPFFSDDGKALLCAKAQDNKDRWLLLLDLPSGQLRLLDRQHDDAWIGGPGIGGWNYSPGNLGWLADNRHIWFQSEQTGFSHLYTLNVETGRKKALTSGRFEILNAQLSNDKKTFYLTSNKETPFEHHFYHLPADPSAGGEMVRITYQPGNHQVFISPDEKWLAIRYSYSNKPWELFLMPNRPGAIMEQATVSTTEAFRAYKWRDPEIIHFTASDGVKVPARIYRPEATRRNGAAVVFVHGAGYLQNVHHWWSSYYREYMFHNILADNGFTVLDIDYRGSKGYGRDWRTAIYRHMGGKDLSDQVDGARYLVQHEGIDAHRIGIYGGSYGGFITLMAMFTAPETFRCGAAIRSVADWAHYNHAYTSNILNTPVTDSIAFRRSSPIYHVEGLQGRLLILHGMIDDNVHFQDVVRLAQRLIEVEKENWEFAVFPLERHGFVEPESWTDEYKRIFKLFRQTLLE